MYLLTYLLTLQQKFYRQEMRDVDAAEARSVTLLSLISQEAKQGARTTVKRAAMGFMVHSRHVQFLLIC